MEFLGICLTSFQRAFKMYLVHFDQHPVLLWKACDCKRKRMCLWSVAETSCEESTRCLSKCVILYEPDYLLVFVSRCIHEQLLTLVWASRAWNILNMSTDDSFTRNSYDLVPFHRAHTAPCDWLSHRWQLQTQTKLQKNDLVAHRHHVLHPLETSEPIEAMSNMSPSLTSKRRPQWPHRDCK